MNIYINQACSFSQVGNRDYQEDCRVPDLDEIDGKQRFYAICDGVGGSCCGELASKTVCESIHRELSKYKLEQKVFTDFDLGIVMDKIYEQLNNVTTEHNQNMATTLVLAIFHQGGVMLAHIGDSRIYHYRHNQGLVYRSEDHSYVNEMVKSGIIKPEDAAKHPKRHVITRAIFPVKSDQDRVAATVAHVKDIREGDVIFLCSDGVVDCVAEKDLSVFLLEDKPLNVRIRNLAEICKNSTDNNTGIAIEIGEVQPDTSFDSDKMSLNITQVEATRAIGISLYRKISNIVRLRKTHNDENNN